MVTFVKALNFSPPRMLRADCNFSQEMQSDVTENKIKPKIISGLKCQVRPHPVMRIDHQFVLGFFSLWIFSFDCTCYCSRVYHRSKTEPMYLRSCRNSTRAWSLKFLTVIPFLIPKVSPAQPTGGRRRRATEMDPDERRQRFLERNRAAASRCRQKRKLWVNSLEKKADDLANINASLTVSPRFPVPP